MIGFVFLSALSVEARQADTLQSLQSIQIHVHTHTHTHTLTHTHTDTYTDTYILSDAYSLPRVFHSIMAKFCSSTFHDCAPRLVQSQQPQETQHMARAWHISDLHNYNNKTSGSICKLNSAFSMRERKKWRVGKRSYRK